jgi:hypothetical protein
MKGQGAIHPPRRIQRGPVHGFHSAPKIIRLEMMLNIRFALSSAPFLLLEQNRLLCGRFRQHGRP